MSRTLLLSMMLMLAACEKAGTPKTVVTEDAAVKPTPPTPPTVAWCHLHRGASEGKMGRAPSDSLRAAGEYAILGTIDPDGGALGRFVSAEGRSEGLLGVLGDRDGGVQGGLLGSELGEMEGGLGFGPPGDGGVGGWGTLGTKPTSKTATVGEGSTSGSLDKSIIQRYIKRNAQKLSYCYEKRLLQNPSLAGTVRSSFEIAGDGTVSKVTAKGFDREIDSCVVGVLSAIQFPKPKGGVVKVNYPFVFKAEGGEAAEERAPVRVVESKSAGRLLDTAELDAWDQAHVLPAVAKIAGALDGCRTDRYAGTVTLTFFVDDEAKVSKTEARGYNDAETEACMARTLGDGLRLEAPPGPHSVDCEVQFAEKPPKRN
jgi:hypothetical protein